MIELYDLAVSDDRRPSPFCWRTKFALKHKGLDWREVPIGFTEKQKIAFAGSTTVPVICDHAHGDKAVKDSWDIAVYLDKAYPDRPLFKSGQARAFARFVNDWTDTVVHAALFPLVVADIYTRARPEDRNYFRETREKRLGMKLEDAQRAARETRVPAYRGTLEPARRLLAEQPFVAGKTPGYPDYALMGTMMWVRVICPLQFLDAGDPVLAWQERMLDQLGGFARKVAPAGEAASS